MEKKLEKIKSFIDEYIELFGGRENKEITNWDEIKAIATFFIAHKGKTPIVDFIDLSNWDCVESFTFNDENRTLELVWHDFREDDDESMRQYFGADVIRAEIKIASVTIIPNKKIPILIFKPYFREQKELNQIYNRGCSEFKFLNSHPFCTQISRVVKRKIELTTIPNINCYTTSVVPDCARFISAQDSKELLYKYNISVTCAQIHKLLSLVEKVDEHEQEELHTYGNTARRYFENALKVLNLKKGIRFEKDYQKLMLGDLTAVLENREDAEKCGFTLQNVLDTLNKCSHDAGVFIAKNDIKRTLLFILAAIILN